MAFGTHARKMLVIQHGRGHLKQKHFVEHMSPAKLQQLFSEISYRVIPYLMGPRKCDFI